MTVALIKFLLELMRILLLLLIITGLLFWFEKQLYRMFDIDIADVYVTAGLANLLIFFVLYRNRFQFSAWYRSTNEKKLSSRLTLGIMAASLLLLLIPPFYLWMR